MLTLITLKEGTYREETFANLKCLFSQKISITIRKIFSQEISIFNLQNLIPIKKRVAWFTENESCERVDKSTVEYSCYSVFRVWSRKQTVFEV